MKSIKLVRILLSFSVLAVSFVYLSATLAHSDPARCNASGLQQFPSVGPAGEQYDGDTLTYTVLYSNTDPDGAGPISPCNITLADASILLPDGSSLPILVDQTLNVGDSISCPGGPGCAPGPYTYAINHGDEIGGSVTAEFDIAGVLHQDASEENASDHDTLSKTVIHPSTLLTKVASAETVGSGDEVIYTYTETNDGDVALTDVSVSDDFCSPVEYVSGDTNLNGELDPGETWEFECTTTLDESTTNVAIAHGLDPRGNDVTWCEDPQTPGQGVFCDQDERAETTVTVIDPLVVEKTAETRYDRDWTWTIDKSADQTELLLAEGEVFSVSYTVELSALSEDMNHLVSGAIVISNPPANPDATIEGVDDTLNVSGAMTVVCPEAFPFVLAAGEQVECTYSGTGATTDTLNEVTVETSGDVPGGTAQAAVVWGDPAAETDECVVLNDTNTGFPFPNTEVCATDEDKTFVYDVSFGSGDAEADVILECGETTHTNTASFLSTDTDHSGEDSWDVHVMVECLIGCTLTQGYWKTHSENGPAPYDDTWALLGDGADTELDDSGMSWYDVFWTPPKGGNVWYQLAHQWMAASLNALNEASVPDDVQAALEGGETWLASHSASDKIKGKDATDAKDWASLLASYNEGSVGPGHCDEQNE